jgi:hypothetical protein
MKKYYSEDDEHGNGEDSKCEKKADLMYCSM